ncbi:MAG TPA: fumarylacetoacetate hydrolase family protein [Flavobacteriales bacterium]|nr:fumarylacetoacetate hydrolase family protein [Flavobacteriales bacterium]HIN39103.1 fumarylacetoacetate hydrolase family protein [Flavobacteriales bacterium]
MKIATFNHNDSIELGLLVNDKLYSISNGSNAIAQDMNDFLQKGEDAMEKARDLKKSIQDGNTDIEGITLNDNDLLAPVPNPPSCKDAYAFRQHVATARRNRGVDMIPEFDQFPIFYFTNHNAILGPSQDILCMPDHMLRLDFELEAAIVIGKKGRNILAKDADEYIAGYLIMNDMSARGLQMEEMKLNLGPAKGKDFCTIIGPYLITKDELADKKVETKSSHVGDTYSLAMKCWVNGELLSEGNMKDMNWTFAEIVERCAYGADVLPGDVIGSGTVGTGCLLELNGTNKLNDPSYEPVWLKEGDVIEMEIEGLGRIKNKVVLENSDHSLFALKKNC